MGQVFVSSPDQNIQQLAAIELLDAGASSRFVLAKMGDALMPSDARCVEAVDHQRSDSVGDRIRRIA